jgi:hypothetical protein
VEASYCSPRAGHSGMVRRILKTVGVVDVPKLMNGCTGMYRNHFNIVLQQFGGGRLTFYARRFVSSLFNVVSKVPIIFRLWAEDLRQRAGES